MSKVVVQEFMTLDGVVQDPGNEGDFEHRGWQIPFIDDEQLKDMAAQSQEVEALLLGRVTYDTFVKTWPLMKGLNGLADRMNEMPKLVASGSARELTWNASVIEGDVVEAVAERKRSGDGKLLVIGSITLAQLLLRNQLVDELRVWIAPVVVGSGRRLFEGTGKLDFSLANTKALSSGVTILTYERTEERRAGGPAAVAAGQVDG
jgi:dihydrofolate reductase